MKVAVIVVGTHHAGKSRTIREYLKPLLGMSKGQHHFALGSESGYIRSQSIEERYGYIFSQSLEEKGLTEVQTIVSKMKGYEKLVFAARPEDESVTLFLLLKTELEKAGFTVFKVKIEKNQPANFYEHKGKEIVDYLKM